MNQQQLLEVFKAWEAIDDAEKVIGGYLYGESTCEDDLQDVLGDLIDRNLALSAMLGELLGQPVEAMREQILSRQREHLSGGV